jgi:alanyl-tRNA synthetase
MQKFYEDAYVNRLETTVSTVNDRKVVLQDTIFYPTGGGQPHDRGMISDHLVLDVFEQEDDVVHLLESAPFSPGDHVECVVDWDYRYTVMRMHSALHLLYNVAGELFGISASAGSNVDAKKSRLDLVYDQVIDGERRGLLKEKFAAVVDEDRPITIWWEGPTRLVQIREYEAMPCGGLHTKSTNEIGYVTKLKRKNVGKGKERLEVFL